MVLTACQTRVDARPGAQEAAVLKTFTTAATLNRPLTPPSLVPRSRLFSAVLSIGTARGLPPTKLLRALRMPHERFIELLAGRATATASELSRIAKLFGEDIRDEVLRYLENEAPPRTG